jgi:hypothetical protein
MTHVVNRPVPSPHPDQPSMPSRPRSTLTKHTILFLAANPLGTDRLALDEEARAIQEELERSGHRDRFELVTRWAVRPLDLLRELRKLKPAIVHFSGHGGCGELRSGTAASRDVVAAPDVLDGDQQHGLFFRGPDGRPQLVSTTAFEETFGAAGSSVKLVVLNACYSEVQAEALLAHVGCVVGMGGSITDDAARNFAIGFYGALGDGESVTSAYQHGRVAMRLEGLLDADGPQLKIREGIDVKQRFLATDSLAIMRSQNRIRERARRRWLSFRVALVVGGSSLAIEANFTARHQSAKDSSEIIASLQHEVTILTPLADAPPRIKVPIPSSPVSPEQVPVPSTSMRSTASDFDVLPMPRNCKGAGAASPMCSHRGTLREMNGRPIMNAKVELVGTDCITTTSELGVFDFKTCDLSQTCRLLHPSIFLHLSEDHVCEKIPLHPPPIITEVSVNLGTCQWRTTQLLGASPWCLEKPRMNDPVLKRSTPLDAPKGSLVLLLLESATFPSQSLNR